MLRYNFYTSFRSIRRNLSFSLINITGLALGLVLVIIMFTWLRYEFSFDRFHENADRIFRVVVEFEGKSASDNFANTPAPLGDAMKNNIPDISDYVRFGYLGRMLVSRGNEESWEDIRLADPTIFKIFSFKLLSGNPATALKNPGSVVLSETKARKYFGSGDPMGQTVFLYDNEVKTPYTVTGVMRDIPANSQIQADILGSFSELKSGLTWGIWNYTTYIMANKSGAFNTISAKLPEIVNKIPEHGNFRLHIQPLTSIHLYSNLRSDLQTNTNLRNVYIISSILILVLLLACINYMNLATSRFTRRGQEAGLRKVSGATNSNLVVQFLFESFAVTLSAFILALFISYLIMPEVISLTGLPLDILSLFKFTSLVKLLFFIILISLISGSYPAIIFSSVSPVSTLRDDLVMPGGISVKGLRRGLVIFQFFISISLIASTLLIRSQMVFIKNKNLGLNSDQVVVVPIYKTGIKPKYDLFKKEILTSPLILSASAVMYFAEGQCGNQNVWWEGLPREDNTNYMSWLDVDQDFFRTLKLSLVQGDFFPLDISQSKKIYYVLNELAVKQIGWKDPVGKQFDILGRGEVIGVVRDFNFRTLHNKLEPMAIIYYPAAFDKLMIKVSAVDIQGALNFIQKKWEALFPGNSFEYSFLSDDFQKMYRKEKTLSEIISYISVFALLISCIGLFGLVMFTIDSRIKEIGLRKIAGSTTGKIVLMLNMEFIKWIVFSFVISCPVILFFMNNWLEKFAYRINLNWWIIASAGIITLIISFLTVSWHTWKFAKKNPVECLKHK
jgi:putative ABC transport system permease protein